MDTPVRVTPMSWRRFVFLIVLCIMMLGACGPTGTPERIVEDYLRAVVVSDEVRSANLSCADWEAQARTDAASFASVEARIEGLRCQPQGEEGEGEDRQVLLRPEVGSREGADEGS